MEKLHKAFDIVLTLATVKKSDEKNEKGGKNRTLEKEETVAGAHTYAEGLMIKAKAATLFATANTVVLQSS